MSHLIVRILLFIFIFPLSGIVYTVVFVTAENFSRNVSYAARDTYAFLTAGILNWGFIAAYWIVLWPKTVRWEGGRAAGTFNAAVGAAMIAALAGAGGD